LKNLTIISFFVFFALQCKSQQLPIYTYYNFNLLGINPATAGSQSSLHLKMGLRQQWVGIEGAPRSAYMSSQGSFGKKRFSFHGAGVTVDTDEAGPAGLSSLNGNYAYHTKVNSENMLSFGASLGFAQYRIDRGLLSPALSFDADPALPRLNSQFVFPQIGVGIWYQNTQRYIGFSIKNLVENELSGLGLDGQTKLRRHFFLTAGKLISLEKKLFFNPSVNLRYVSSAPVALDFTAVLNYDESIEAGLAFRGGHGISGLVKINVLKYLTVGYAYDLTLNKIRLGARNSHEVFFGIQANPRGESKGIRCSAYQ